LVLVGNSLYATHEEWVDRPARYPTVRYWANRIDLSDRAHPRIASRVNIPGVLIGGPKSDPSLLYVTGYRWDGNQVINSFDVLRLHGNSAELVGMLDIGGWVGRTFVRDSSALVSVQQWGKDYMRQGDDLFISTGYWGVETLHLAPTP
jgi:hypothetical protein